MSFEAAQSRCGSIKYRLISSMNNWDAYFSWDQKKHRRFLS